MPEYEAVIYSIGCSLYYIPDSNPKPTLKPKIKEKGRFATSVVYKDKKPRRSQLYYIYEQSDEAYPFDDLLFTSETDLKSYCRENGYKLGTDYFMKRLVSDEAWQKSGPRD
jgi:hypothetical protein